MQEQTTYLPIAAVRARYGNVSDVTIWRWMRNPAIAFPAPSLRPHSRSRLWALASLEAWEASRSETDAE